ncbi:MAG: AAA family ATPase [Anaerolineales bacterium]|nr:AAA family ATPase [Anaerolineales bacterium]
MSFIIAIANEKGGVGKTTSTLSLGAAISETNQRVLVIDLDPQANLTLSLGYKPNSLQRSMVNVMMGDQRISSLILTTSVDRLDLAPSNHDMHLTEDFLRIRKDYHELLRDALAEVPDYDYIIIDCPPSVGALTQSALASSDLHILPTQCEYFSTHAIRSSLALIRDIRDKSNPLLRYRLLLTMCDPNNRLHQSLNDQIRKIFGGAVFNSVIEVDDNLRECPLYAQPITTFAPQSLGALQYRQLAQELIQYARETIRRSSQAA